MLSQYIDTLWTLQLLIILYFFCFLLVCLSIVLSILLSRTDAPVCSSSVIGVIGASLEEAVPIPCRVNSDPPEIDFEWTFSSSGEHFEVPSGHYATIQDPTMSTSSDVRRTVFESNDTHFESYGKLGSHFCYLTLCAWPCICNVD